MKLAYIKLNRQTPCPPCGAVPVNQECCGSSFTRNTRIAFGHGGDHPSYVTHFYLPAPLLATLKMLSDQSHWPGILLEKKSRF
jgi:hypothetical protein